MDKNVFHEKINHYLHLNYDERMANNEEMFKSAQSKHELKELFCLFLNCGVHSYEERLLIRIMGVADTNDDWKFLKFHGRNYPGIYYSAIKALEPSKESVSWLFFNFSNIFKTKYYLLTLWRKNIKYVCSCIIILSLREQVIFNR